ncbi:hypothetical protein DFJ73DRAFT_319121 [Zopfochytrium polystomum]|nr:hypothetical protein DFJ73DRAFT_319121 [Zopfochytrium polystomum]
MEEAETAEETGGKEGDEEGDGTEEPSPAAAGNERDVEAPEATREESIAKRILALCPHYLASDDPNFSTFVLALVRRAIPLMHARSAERNQAIHALWPGVVRRLSSPDHRVVAAALDAVKAFASEAREFVKRRVVDDVLPRVDSFLRTFEPHASKAARRHHHQHLQQQQQQQQQQTLVRWDPQVPDGTRTRVLTCALEMMALILDALPAFSVRELKQILDVVWPFVQVGETGVEDPRGLVRTAAASVLAGVQAHDADLVWLKRQQEACASANQAAEFVPAKQNPGCNRLEMPRWVMGEIRRGNAGG